MSMDVAVALKVLKGMLIKVKNLTNGLTSTYFCPSHETIQEYHHTHIDSQQHPVVALFAGIMVKEFL